MSALSPLGRLAAAATFTVKVLGVALLGYAALMFVMQRRVVFPGVSLEPSRASAIAPAGITQVWLQLSFGRVEAWFFRAAGDGAQPTVVFAHGNAELIDDWQDEMGQLRDAGVNTLLVEFPGYGFSDGAPSRAALTETFNAAYDWLIERTDVDADRIVAYGRSIGGGPAADLAVDRRVSALVLQSTFTSTVAMARAVLLPGFLVRDRFDNRRAITEFDGPVLVMHGIDDDVIPYQHAEGLASARQGLGVTVIDCAHNDCAPEWPHIMKTLTSFLESNGLMSSESDPSGSG
jgi:pimeloyl-ACP methyl ester carboxylesterase